MDATIISNWNDRVKPGDTVYVLGDFLWLPKSKTKAREQAAAILARLNGDINLVPGNHDKYLVRAAGDMMTILPPLVSITLQGKPLVLCHYALRTWRAKGYGALQLHGHSHGNLSPFPGQCDVGVDVWDFAPATFEEVKDRIGEVTPSYPPRDTIPR